MKKYLTKEEIETVTELCENFYTEKKKELRKLSKKFDCEFNFDEYHNLECFHNFIENEMMKLKPNAIANNFFGGMDQNIFLTFQKGGIPEINRWDGQSEIWLKFVSKYIKNNYSEDYNYIRLSDFNNFKSNVLPYLTKIDKNENYDNSVDLSTISDYKRHFEKYSINSIDAKELESIDKFRNELIQFINSQGKQVLINCIQSGSYGTIDSFYNSLS
jgi:hypothetical protein